MAKRKSPRFVKVKLLRDGTAELIDDDGENYHVEMRRDQSWPMISKRVRPFELRETLDKIRKPVVVSPPPPAPFRPRLIFDDAS